MSFTRSDINKDILSTILVPMCLLSLFGLQCQAHLKIEICWIEVKQASVKMRRSCLRNASSSSPMTIVSPSSSPSRCQQAGRGMQHLSPSRPPCRDPESPSQAPKSPLSALRSQKTPHWASCPLITFSPYQLLAADPTYHVIFLFASSSSLLLSLLLTRLKQGQNWLFCLLTLSERKHEHWAEPRVNLRLWMFRIQW